MNSEGRIGSFQRVMSHVLWPLGVDALFSFNGNISYLEENLPYVDRTLGYLNTLASAEDSLPCFPKDLMKLFPPGVDWNGKLPKPSLLLSPSLPLSLSVPQRIEARGALCPFPLPSLSLSLTVCLVIRC